MRTYTIRFLSMAVATASTTLLMLSCSLPLQRQQEHAAPVRQHTPVRQITQLDFARHASFAVCTEPTCPARTRKTLPVTPQAVPQPSMLVSRLGVDLAPTLDPDEVLLTAGHQASNSSAAPFQNFRAAKVVVHFDTNSAVLSGVSRAALDRAASDAGTADRIVITGRTDNVGSNNLNQALALARARSVRNYLRAKLPARGHVLALEAQGACCFTASNSTLEGRRHNRRVEIDFSVSGQVAP